MARRPVIGAVVDRLTENRPLAAAIVAGHRAAANDANTTTTHGDEDATTDAINAAIADSPEAVNGANMEPKRESRIVTGGVASTLSALSTFFAGLAGLLGGLGPAFTLSGPSRWVSIIVTLLGGAGSSSGIFVLYGRLKDNLPPMHRTLWNPLSWLARSKEQVMANPTGQGT